MTPDDLQALRQWFREYTDSFYTNDPVYNHALEVKTEHTERVCRNCVRLGEALELPEQEMLLAETIGLFHDIGRYHQYRVYGTFKDADSEDHARLGIRELALNGVLSEIDPADRQKIIRAIAFHNRFILPGNEPPERLRLMRLIRDADKLDIWHVFAVHYRERDTSPNPVIEQEVDEATGVSDEILDALLVGEMARLKEMRSLTDFKLLQISWVYDLNVRETFRIAKEYGHMAEIAATLPQDPEIRAAVERAFQFVDAVIAGNAEPRAPVQQ